MSGALLQVDGLTMQFGGLRAVDNVSFQAHEREITALIGPNGAGKTTVFNCITGFYRPTDGSMAIRSGKGALKLEKLPGHDVARRARVARTFQNVRLFPRLTVLENLLVAQHNQLVSARLWGVFSLLGFGRYRQAENEAVARARTWLERARLLDRADETAGSLPYGAQRRLEIIRAMCTDPLLLCLDEPAAGLNPRETAELNELLLLIRSEGCSILLIEHDMSMVMRISDHVVVLEHGRKISDGTPEMVRNDPLVISAYLGDDSEEEEG